MHEWISSSFRVLLAHGLGYYTRTDLILGHSSRTIRMLSGLTYERVALTLWTSFHDFAQSADEIIMWDARCLSGALGV
ncbi:hypothetical protein VTO73DRAFT_9673 [Trametes versicolor]